jgi:uncharacterized protein YkwD
VLRKERVGQQLLLALLVAIACSPAPLPRSSSFSPEPPPRSKTIVNWGDTYGAPVDASPNRQEIDLWKRLTGLACERDGRLSKAARHHAEILLESPGGVSEGELDHLRFTVLQLGGYDYGVNPVVTELGNRGIAFLRSHVRKQGGLWTHCGLGVAGTGKRTIAVLVGVVRTLELSPLPAVVTPPRQLLLTVRSTRVPSGEVVMYLGRPDMTVTAVPPRKMGEGVQFEIPITESGRYDLELLHDQGHGPETAVLVPIFAGIPPDPRPTVIPRIEDDDNSSPEAMLFQFVNAAREKVGASPLVRDGRLDRVARRHSNDMVRNRFFGHISPFTGNLDRRLDSAGLAPKHSAENIAVSSTLIRIHRNLMASPAHRINILNPVFTHMGIGVARGDEQIATEIFVAW